MSQPDANTRSEVDRWNQVLLTMATGAEIAAFIRYFPGMLVFCTATGSGFTAGLLYQRNEANDNWRIMLDLTTAQTFSGKSLSGSSNTFTNIGTSSINNQALTAAKLASALHKGVFANSSVAFTTSSTTYVDVTGMTCTITAAGNKAGLIADYVSNIENNGVNNQNTLAVTDGAGTVKSEFSYVQHVADREQPINAPSFEAAPSPGASLTRKMRMKVDAGTGALNNSGLVNGSSMYLVERL
jgi:hypothetical protein